MYLRGGFHTIHERWGRPREQASDQGCLVTLIACFQDCAFSISVSTPCISPAHLSTTPLLQGHPYQEWQQLETYSHMWSLELQGCVL